MYRQGNPAGADLGRLRLRVLATGAALAWASAAQAAAPPAAAPPPASASPSAISGGLIDKGEALQNGVNSPAGAPVPPPTPKPKAGPSGPAFLLTAVKFNRSRFLKPAELDRLAAPLIGKQVTLADLQHLADEINALYAKRGVLTGRAFVPPQRVSGGVVRVELVESKLGKLTVKATGYTGSEYVTARVKPKSGETLDIIALQKDIGRFNRNNDSQIQASLSPGLDPGTTDILLTLRDPARNSLQLFVDNEGYESTGRYEGGFLARRNDLFMDGDHASVYLLGSDGSITGNASYNIPADILGGRLGVTYAHSNIDVVNGSTSSLGVHGISDTGSLNLAIPLVSQDDWTLTLTGVSSVIHSKDTLSGTVIDDTIIAKETVGLSATRAIWRWARLTGDVQTSWAALSYNSGTGAPSFWEGNADFDFATARWKGLTFHVDGAAQYIDHDVVPGTQLFQVGGPSSVRGYAPGVATGHAGYDVQSDLHAALPWVKKYLDPYVFADAAEVWTTGATHARADGAGFGFIIGPIKRVSLQASYAFALDRLSATQYGNRLDLKAVLSF
jgi:hemolysin activation/secretion protein